MLACEHVSTQGVLAREHVSTLGTLARHHVSTFLAHRGRNLADSMFTFKEILVMCVLY